MYDNGLIKFYNSKNVQNGYLDATSLDLHQCVSTDTRKIERVRIDGSPYILKAVDRLADYSKASSDAEILLSQIYCKAGIESALYFPAYNSYGNFLITDDVSTDKNMLAGSYLYPYLTEAEIYGLPFLLPPKSLKLNPSRVLTKNAMEEQTRMRVLDTASYNYDRHYQNFFYNLQHSMYVPSTSNSLEEDKTSAQVMTFFRNLLPNKANGVVAIDFESSGEVLAKMAEGDEYADYLNIYENDFDFYAVSRDEMLNQIRTNESLAEMIDKSELAETMGNLNPKGVAEDIKQTIGYQVDPKVVDELSRSYDEMAELLTQ